MARQAMSSNDTRVKHKYLTPDFEFDIQSKKGKTKLLMTDEEFEEFCNNRKKHIDELKRSKKRWL